jgi:FO synthase
MDALLEAPLDDLLAAARERRRLVDGGGGLVTYSPKVFIPLTTLCRDVCGYCTFARPPRRGERAYMTEDEVLAIARAGAAAGCTEALFTLGDKPELRYKVAREELRALGCATTLEYLGRMAKLVLDETGLLPHLNPGVMSRDELAALRPVSASMGIMLETLSDRLSAKGGPHWASPDKVPARRLKTIALAGELRIPFTSGILIGIGETRAERLEALEALRDLHERYGHLQEVIVQNFRAKPGTRMAAHPEPSLDDHLWTIAAARILLPDDVAVQAPPNLAYDDFPRLLDAGIDDWGGVSPVTIDHVNPEAPWPDRDRLAAATRSRGLELAPRLPVYPQYLSGKWLDPRVLPAALRGSDALGLAREDGWHPGEAGGVPFVVSRDAIPVDTAGELGEEELVRLFRARGEERQRVFAAADRLRREVCGDEVSYVVTRNIQYTNVCYFRCSFCAFSKGRLAANLRGAPYLVPHDEIVRRAREAWDRGATEVCLQGGIHPAFTGDYYASVVEAIRDELADLHIHAFSALEVWQGAATLGLPLEDYLARLRTLGLGSLPGTAAEILDDEVRAIICPDKVTTRQWLAVHEAAHRVGLRSNVTIMFGHVERPEHWARHLLRAREQQERSGGFTEFVPLPFIHMEAPMWLRGQARSGPTFGESLLVHAVARLALHPAITNIQVSWVKLGPEGVAAALNAGVNDLGGTLMNESISRAAGSEHGQEMSPEAMEALIRANGRVPRQRTTLYEDAPAERRAASFAAPPLAEPLNPPVHDAGLKAPPRLVRPGFLARASR